MTASTTAQQLERIRSPGYQYAWLSADTVLDLVVGGHSRLPREPMTAGTTLNAYSVAKTLTAAGVIQLAERGLLDLDAPVGSLLDFALPYREQPTIRQTLAHLGGWPAPLPLSWVHLVAEHDAFDRQAFVTRVVRANPRLKSAPGSAFAYSNLGYLLLGAILERVTHTAFEAFIEQQVIQPLALPGGAVLSFAIPELKAHAHGHIRRFGVLDLLLGRFLDRRKFVAASTGRWVEIHHHYANGAAYGGLIANALGLARYLQALLEPGDWLTPATHALLFAPVRTSAGVELRRSLGWFRGEVAGQRYFAHAGGGAGYYCEARLYPDVGRASVVMLNRAGIADQRILDSLDRPHLRRVG